MADLLSVLSVSSNSLSAQSDALATANNNVANATTPGYSRQTADLMAVFPAERVSGATIGMGVALQTVTQSRDRFLEAQMPAALSQAASSSSESDALSAVSALNPDAANGLAASVGSFYAGLTALAQNPGDPGLRQAAVASTQQMTLTFNGAAASLAQARSGLDAQVSASTSTANDLSASIASLNKQIRIARSSGGAPNDLLDARQLAQDQLTQLTGAQPVADAQGDVSMVLGSGQALVTVDQSAQLSTAVDPTNRGHLAVQITGTDGSGPSAVSGLGGNMGGQLSARDGALATAESGLDTLAFDLAGTVNTVHRAGFGLDGVSGRDLLDPGATVVGAAANLQVSAAVLANPGDLAAASSAATTPGDASNLEQLIATEQTPLSTGANVDGGLSNIISQFGSSAASIAALSTQDSAVSDHLTQMRASTSGVSIDEEMVNMTKTQNAYDALIKVITTADQMLQTLMQLQPAA